MHLSLAEVVMIVLAAGQLIYAALDYRSRTAPMQINQTSQHRHPTLIIALFMLLTWAAVAFEYVDRNYLHAQQTYVEYMQAWGLSGNSYLTQVDTKLLLQYSGEYKLGLIIRVPYADRDRMIDTVIEKSGLYTITGDVVVLAHPSSNILRFLPNQATPVEYTLILVPSKFTVEHISSLNDVEHIGGRILATHAQIIPISEPLIAVPSGGK